jgi:hypothetical protein
MSYAMKNEKRVAASGGASPQPAIPATQGSSRQVKIPAELRNHERDPVRSKLQQQPFPRG